MNARRSASVLVVVLLASWTTSGLCFMPATGEPGPRDAHACCKKGWTEGRPECCMAGAADEEPARIAASAPLAGPPLATSPVAPTLDRARAAGFVVPIDRSHSPPGRIPLRI